MARFRDYGLSGVSTKEAIDSGLVSANWYQTPIERKTMKQLMARSDQSAIRDTLILLSVMLVSLCGGVFFWGSWWSVPFWLVYGVLYGSAMDSRWHECGHGTAFKTAWMNNALYQLASFMMIRNPEAWRWSHSRHHTDTIIVGRDPEIVAMRPTNLPKILLGFVGVADAYEGLKQMLLNAFGKFSADELDYIPASELSKAVRVARHWCLIYWITLMSALAMGSLLPLMIIGLPRLYGAWHHVLTGIIQHAGLADNVIDHRLNSRTCYMNPVSRFIYWNMNYHVEHHMFPMVPYHKLPALHEILKADTPAPSKSILDAYREIWPILKRQQTDPDYFLLRDLPATANPYLYSPKS